MFLCFRVRAGARAYVRLFPQLRNNIKIDLNYIFYRLTGGISWIKMYKVSSMKFNMKLSYKISKGFSFTSCYLFSELNMVSNMVKSRFDFLRLCNTFVWNCILKYNSFTGLQFIQYKHKSFYVMSINNGLKKSFYAIVNSCRNKYMNVCVCPTVFEGVWVLSSFFFFNLCMPARTFFLIVFHIVQMTIATV